MRPIIRVVLTALMASALLHRNEVRGVLCLALLPSLALAQVVAVVVSVEQSTLTLRVVSGEVMNGAAVEVFSPGETALAALALHGEDGFLLQGDTATGVVLEGVSPRAGAIVATPGTFESLEVALQASKEPAAPARITHSAAGCVFSPAELQEALGFAVEEGKGTRTNSEQLTETWCQYRASEPRKERVTVRRMLLKVDRTTAAVFAVDLEGTKTPIPNDPDRAVWLSTPDQPRKVVLAYGRGEVMMTVEVSWASRKDKVATAAMKKRLLALRRAL